MRKALLSIRAIVILIAFFFGVKMIVDSKTGPKPEVKKDIKIVTTAAVMTTRISIVIPANGNLQAKNAAANTSDFERSQERFKLSLVSSRYSRQSQVNLLNAERLEDLAKYEAKVAEYQLLSGSEQILTILL